MVQFFNLDRMCQTKNGKGSMKERIHNSKIKEKVRKMPK
jgi:hypothetical protein